MYLGFLLYHNMDIEGNYNVPLDVEWRMAIEQLKLEEEEAMKKGTYNYGFQPMTQSGPTISQTSFPQEPTTWASSMGTRPSAR